MSDNTSFFVSPQAAAIYKHGLLKRYIPKWAGKVGSQAIGGRVVIYDAYAGPGRYEDANPGSPELVVDIGVAMANLRNVYTVFSDQDSAYVAKLRVLLGDKGVPSSSYEVREGPVQEHIDNVFSGAGNSPVFLFLDPFGLTLPFDRLVEVLTMRDAAGQHPNHQPKIELLMNFSYEAVRRIAGVLLSAKDYPAKAGQILALDRALGGEWWQAIVRAEGPDWVDQLLEEFANRLGLAAVFGYVTASVGDNLNVKPAYELILFTRHSDGLWEMASAMSLANKDWRDWLKEDAERTSGGQMKISGVSFDDDEDSWIAEIASNIRQTIAEIGSFTIQNEFGQIMGRTLGLARETHIRKALRLLVETGDIAECPKGPLQRATIYPAS